jgi:cytochrome c
VSKQLLAPCALAPLVVLAMPVASQTAPAPAGQALFKSRCQICHSPVANGPSAVGPVLAGVVGRKAGATKFNYSPALKTSKLVWSKDLIDKYLAGPTKLVPGTKMVISVSDANQRKQITDYLATLK